MRKALVLGVFGLAGTLASPVFAADDFSGFRLGMHFNQDQLEGDFAYQGLGVEPVNNNRLGYGVFAGYGFNRYFALEAGLHSGGKFNSDSIAFASTIPNILPTNPDLVDDAPFFKIRNNVKSIDMSAVGSIWIGEKLSFFGRLGGMYWDGETSYSFGDPDGGVKTVDEVTDTGFAPMGGLGVQTTLDRALVRIEYQYVDLGDLAVGSYFGQFDNIIQTVSFSIVWTVK